MLRSSHPIPLSIRGDQQLIEGLLPNVSLPLFAHASHSAIIQEHALCIDIMAAAIVQLVNSFMTYQMIGASRS